MPVSWSAPSYFDLMVPGGGAEFSKVELCFVVPDDTTLSLFTRGSVGMELPRSRGEFSLAPAAPLPPPTLLCRLLHISLLMVGLWC